MRLTRLLHPRLSISGWLIVVSLMASLPLLAFSTLLVYHQITDEQAKGRASMEARAKVAATALGREIESLRIELSALAQAETLRRNDLPAFYEFMTRVARRTDARIDSISLSDRDGFQPFVTALPYGTALPAAPGAEFQQPLFDGTAPFVLSPLIQGPWSKRFLIGMAVPVPDPQSPRLVLRLSIDLRTLTARLNDQEWPPDWTAALLDQNNIIIARSKDASKFVGEPATDSLIRAREAGQSSFTAVTKDGTSVVSFLAPIAGTGWTVAVGRPLAVLEAEVRSAVMAIMGLGLACAGLGVVSAHGVARVLHRQLRIVVDAAGHSEAGRVPASSVAEVDKLAKALRRAHASVGEAQGELREARNDALTGLAGRTLFLDAAQALLDQCLGSRDRSAALLFIDLDSFKQINDRLGHDAGDLVLQKVAAAIRGVVRAHDIAGRWGGDEFVICVQAPTAHVAGLTRSMAERIVEAVAAIGEGIGCSVGVSLFSAGGSLPDLLAQADRAMLCAKQSGKNRIVENLLSS